MPGGGPSELPPPVGAGGWASAFDIHTAPLVTPSAATTTAATATSFTRIVKPSVSPRASTRAPLEAAAGAAGNAFTVSNSAAGTALAAPAVIPIPTTAAGATPRAVSLSNRR